MPTCSFVIPVLNEEAGLAELHRRLGAVAEKIDGDCEFVFVDDGSTDASRELLLRQRDVDPRVKLLFLSRNFGHQLALTAGIDYAAGDAVVIMDADLQDPPEVVPEMVARWREGYEVVHAVRARRADEGRLKLWAAHLFYRLMRRASDEAEIPLNAADFRLVDRRVADVVRRMREPDRYLRGLFSWVGFRQTAVEYERAERYAGEAKYSWSALGALAANGMLGFSTAPLRLILVAGFAISTLAFAAGIATIALKLADVFSPPGWASLMVIVTFAAGVQLVVLGTVGIYVARIYEQGRERPLYVLAEAHGLGGDSERGGDHAWRAERQPGGVPLEVFRRR